jgi:excinuclease ABC subunit A
VLFENLTRAKGLATENAAGAVRRITGHENVSSVVLVDQSPLSRTPKSTPALYLGVFDHIREKFACTEQALSEGLSASAFSFNGGAGRCERCSGSGFERVEMQFLSDVFVRCPECEGRRYQPHILKVKLCGKSITDVLAMTVTEAIQFFGKLGATKVTRPLAMLEEVGLGYLSLGQPLNILSGGESQRLKLVERLTSQEKPAAGTLLILDEPTTGLHFDDIAMLLRVFERLVEQGNSLLVIEHNVEVIKCADYLIDLGPEAGADGGDVVATGTPEALADCPASHTGRALIDVLREKSCEHFSARAAEAQSIYGVVKRTEEPRCITVHGAREHNLRIPKLSIPRGEMVVITGLSGSGKSTLAFDLLFAEGQRRFLDVMSPYARQFVEQLEKPDVDLIARRWKKHRCDGHGSLSFSAPTLRKTRNAALSRLRFCGGKTDGFRSSPKGRRTCKERRCTGFRNARESAEGLPYGCRTMGKAPGFHHAARGWKALQSGYGHEAGALPRTHHRSAGRRSCVGGQGVRSAGEIRARYRARDDSCAGCKRAWHRVEHGALLP